jgi:CarD family transcriptional regulator
VARTSPVTAAMVAGAYRAAAGDLAPQATSFKTGDFVVYPAHGVGRIDGIGVEELAGYRIDMVRISFADTLMILRIPVRTAVLAGLRPLSTPETLADVLATLHGRPRVSRVVWSRRAREYQERINTGDIRVLAEVVRDLHRPSAEPPSSHSQRTLLETAIERLAGEFAAVSQTDKSTALLTLETALLGRATAKITCHARAVADLTG